MTRRMHISKALIVAVGAMLPFGTFAASAQSTAPAAQTDNAAQPPAPTPHSAKPKKSKAPQSGAQSLGLGNHDSNAPIDITADNFDYDMNAKIGTYTGNVIVIQGDMRMRSDSMKVNVVQGKPTLITAIGHVVVNAPNGTGTGDKGVYDPGPRTMTMTGKVVLTKEKDVMRGTKLVMDMNTNVAHMYAQGMPGGRVQSLFIPPPKQNATGSTPNKNSAKTKPAGGDASAAQPSE